MNRRLTAVLAALALGGVPAPVPAQMRATMTASPPAPAARPTRPGSPRPQPGPPPAAPFRSTLAWRPDHVPPMHGRLPLRLPWFGLVVFDPYWPYWGSPDGLVPEPGLASIDGPPDRLPTGGLQIDVEPRRALVYVDGFFAGPVERFSGYFQHLDLPAGLHHLDIVDPDYDPLVADVAVTPGRTSTYRASLNRAR